MEQYVASEFHVHHVSNLKHGRKVRVDLFVGGKDTIPTRGDDWDLRMLCEVSVAMIENVS